MKKKPIVVKEWIEAGELNPENKRMPAIMEECGSLMDGSCACDILGGGILFKATNGKYYTITIEAIVGEASPEFIKETLAELVPVKEALDNFFWSEIDNERFGGDRPSTLDSALGSWVQAPNEEREDFCGGKTSLLEVETELRKLIKKHGKSMPLSSLASKGEGR